MGDEYDQFPRKPPSDAVTVRRPRGRDTVERLREIAENALTTVQPERFWHDVAAVCDLAAEASHHLSQIIPEDRSGWREHGAMKFLQGWDHRE